MSHIYLIIRFHSHRLASPETIKYADFLFEICTEPIENDNIALFLNSYERNPNSFIEISNGFPGWCCLIYPTFELPFTQVNFEGDGTRCRRWELECLFTSKFLTLNTDADAIAGQWTKEFPKVNAWRKWFVEINFSDPVWLADENLSTGCHIDRITMTYLELQSFLSNLYGGIFRSDGCIPRQGNLWRFLRRELTLPNELSSIYKVRVLRKEWVFDDLAHKRLLHLRNIIRGRSEVISFAWSEIIALINFISITYSNYSNQNVKHNRINWS